jgi:hypothetical protein
MLENKCEQLFAKCGKFGHVQSAKHAVVIYKNTAAVYKAKDGLL